MIKFFLLLFLLSSTIAFTQLDKNYPSAKQRKDFYKQLTDKYVSPAVKEIFNTDVTGELEAYVDGHSEKELIYSYSTVIHELLHGYNGFQDKGYKYFIEPGLTINVPISKYYNSKELNSFVRKGLQDSVFRYGLYLGGKNEVGSKKFEGINDSKKTEVMSISHGIYGLAEEFDAYYQGAQSAFDLYGYYQKTYPKPDDEGWEDYKSRVLSENVAYYEFNLFVGWYLMYAKKKQPEIYKDMMANKALRVTFSLIDLKYKDLIEKSEKRLAAILPNAEGNGLQGLDLSGSEEDMMRFFVLAGLEEDEIYEKTEKIVNGKKVVTKKLLIDDEDFQELKDEYLNFVQQFRNAMGDGKSANSIVLFYADPLNYVPYLKKQFSAELNAELNNFRISGITTLNYKTHLK